MGREKVKVQGERWFPSEKSFSDEMKDLWGNWYCDSETGKLRAVLMHRPGREIDGMTEAAVEKYRFRGVIDPGRAREEHDKLAEVYRNNGVEVHYVENQRIDRPNAMFTRDLMLMTPEGAIVSRPAVSSRRGEEKAVAEKLIKLGIPVLKTVNGSGFFEGANAMWIDRETVILGTGSRTNDSGAQQVERELRGIGVTEIIHAPVPYGSIHLDGFMNMVDTRKLAVFPWHLAYDTAELLMNNGIELIELTNIVEIKNGMALNFIVLEPGKIVMPAGCPDTRTVFESHQIEVIEVEMTELLKGWGAVHCMTAFLRRDPSIRE
jgi:arginine deiminase